MSYHNALVRQRKIFFDDLIVLKKQPLIKRLTVNSSKITSFTRSNLAKKKTPQTVFKVIHYGKGSGKSVLNYMLAEKESTHDNDQPYLDEHKKIYCSSGEILTNKTDINNWLRENKPIKERKNSGSYIHFVLSADTNAKKADKVLYAAEETLQEHYGNYGFTYTYSLDTNTEKPHVHVMLQTTNQYTREKVSIWKPQIHAIRKTFATVLTAQGIKHQASIKPNNKIDAILEKNIIVSQFRKKHGTANTHLACMKLAEAEFDLSWMRTNINTATTELKDTFTQWKKEHTTRQTLFNKFGTRVLQFWNSRTAKDKQLLLQNIDHVRKEDIASAQLLKYNQSISTKCTVKFGIQGRKLYASLISQAELAQKENKLRQQRRILQDLQKIIVASDVREFKTINLGNIARIKTRQQASKALPTPYAAPSNNNLDKTQPKLASAEVTNTKERLLSVKKLTGSTTQSNKPQNASKSAREKLLAVADDEVKQKQQHNLKLKT